MPVLAEIRGIPRQIKIRAEEETSVTYRDEPHVRRSQNVPPGSHRARAIERIDGAVGVQSADLRQFRLIHGLVIFRMVAINGEEEDSPENAHRSENIENPAPAESEQNAARDKRRDGDSKSTEEMRDALDAPAL